MRATRVLVLLALLASAMPQPLAAAEHDDALRETWPTFRGDAARTGIRGHADGPGTGEVLWRFRMPSFAGPSPPAYASGKIFVGGEDVVLAIGARSADILWTAEVDGRVRSSPVVSDGVVFAGTQNPDGEISQKGVLYAFDARTGERLWQRGFNDSIVYAPLVWNGTLYVGALAGGFHALSPRDGALLWTYPIGREVRGDPVADADGIYVSTTAPGPLGVAQVGALHRLDPGSPRVVWSRETAAAAFAAAISDAGVAWAGGRDILVIDPADGSVVWNRSHVPALVRAPVLSGDELIFTRSDRDRESRARNWTVQAISMTSGVPVWAIHSEEDLSALPIKAAGFLYHATAGGEVVAFSAPGGTEIWRVPAGGFMMPSLLLVDGVLYANAEDLHLVALDAGAGLGLQKPSDGPQARVSYAGWVSLSGLLVTAFFVRRRRETIEISRAS